MPPARDTPELLRATVIDPYGVRGGAASWLLDLLGAAVGLEPRGLLLRDGPLRDDLQHLGIPTEVIPTGPSPVSIARGGLRVARHLRRSRPDIVLANGVKAAAVAAVARRLADVPVVWAKHDFSHDARLGRRLARHVDLVVGTSRAVVRSIGLPDAPLLPPPRPSSPPASATVAQQFWRDLGVEPTTGPTAVVVGRLTPYKRVQDAIQAIAAARCATWRLVVVGADDWSEPGERARLEAQAASADVADRVMFAGEVADAGRWLAAFDAVIVPTSVNAAGFGGEGFGIVVLESLLAGVPVIATEGIPALALGTDAVIAVARERPDEISDALVAIGSVAAAARANAADLWSRHPDATHVASELVTLLRSTSGRGQEPKDPQPGRSDGQA